MHGVFLLARHDVKRHSLVCHRRAPLCNPHIDFPEVVDTFSDLPGLVLEKKLGRVLTARGAAVYLAPSHRIPPRSVAPNISAPGRHALKCPKTNYTPRIRSYRGPKSSAHTPFPKPIHPARPAWAKARRRSATRPGAISALAAVRVCSAPRSCTGALA